MKKIGFYFFALCLLLQTTLVIAQSDKSTDVLKEEQEELIRHLHRTSTDSTMVYGLSRFINLKIDSIRVFILFNDALPAGEKEKATRSLLYFIKELSENISKQKMNIYEIPGAFESYKTILSALLYHKPFDDALLLPGANRSQLLATTFSQYNEYSLLNDAAVYKRMSSSPEFILRFLQGKERFRYADSLVLIAAAHDPLKFAADLSKSDPNLQNNIRKIKNIYLHETISIAADKNASELLPFVTVLAENRITADTILMIRKDVTSYFQLLVNIVKQSQQAKDPFFVFQKLLRNGIKEKSLSFYVNQINEQHSAKDAVRFASVKGLRPEDMYYIITSCSDELYTSSYLGLYKRLMEYFNAGSADSLFRIVHYDNFRTFMRLAANYNVLTDFLNKMPPEKAAELLKRFISGIESDINTGLEKAMDIADSFTGLDSAIVIRELIQKELQSNLDRCQSNQLYFGIQLYSILLQVFDLVKQKDDLIKLWSTLGNYDMLKRNALQNKNGEIVELVFFYGDVDGVASFNNFQKLFTGKSKWKISKNEAWITIRSGSDEPIVIYANLPLNNKEELDLKAQDTLFSFLEQQGIKPAVLIHRGHSYHLGNTLKRLTPSVKLAILGSCGGYNSAISIASINPDVQIIGSKKTGSKSINDVIINVINETLENKKDLSWSEIWEKLATRFSKDEFTLNLFNEYIPPGKNVSLFVLKLFNFYNRVV
jgi:hypothetical protein